LYAVVIVHRDIADKMQINLYHSAIRYIQRDRKRYVLLCIRGDFRVECTRVEHDRACMLIFAGAQITLRAVYLDLHSHSTSSVVASWTDLSNSVFLASQVYTSPFMSSV